MALAGCHHGAELATKPAAPTRIASKPTPNKETVDIWAAYEVGLAQQALSDGLLAHAEWLYGRIFARYPKACVIEHATCGLAELRFRTGKPQEALEMLVELATHGRDANARDCAGAWAARVYADIGDSQVARPFFERLDPVRVDDRLRMLAHYYDAEGKTADATLVEAQIIP
jgi:hypothetical protein